MNDVETFISRIGFRFVPPGRAPGQTYLRLEYRLRKVGIPVGLLNTRFPEHKRLILRSLLPLVAVPGLSTFAIAGIVNEAVRRMPTGQTYVNVGTWHGFTLFAGMLGNETSRCIGVDNFSEGLGADRADVRSAFLRQFDRWRSLRHDFFEGDYLDYFDRVHQGPIGLYLYDGGHSYEDQLRALEVAERFFAQQALIMIDDAYAAEVRSATEDFMASRPGCYKVVLDQPVATKGHPTFWNGFLILRRV